MIVPDLITLLTVLCFSFLITIFTISLNKGNSLLKLQGSIFTVPFFLSLSAFFYNNRTYTDILVIHAEIVVLISLFLINNFKPAVKNHSLILFIIYAYPFALLASLPNAPRLTGFLHIQYVNLTLIVAVILLNMFFLRKEKGTKEILFWSMLCILCSYICKEIGKTDSLLYIALSLRLAAYITFFLYFYKETYSIIMSKVNEAEKKINTINRSLDMEVKKRVFEIERSNEKLLNISRTDALTKAYNKAAIIDIIGDLVSQENSKEFSIFMFDIDNFKFINDTLGHIEGDKCIKKLSVIAKNSIRDIDSLGRYGGDEFIIVLPGTSAPQAKLIAERFRKKVEETESPHFTVSAGISTFPRDGSTVKELIATADEGLYLSKRKGRNAVSHKGIF